MNRGEWLAAQRVLDLRRYGSAVAATSAERRALRERLARESEPPVPEPPVITGTATTAEDGRESARRRYPRATT